MFELEKLLKKLRNPTREKNEFYGGWSHTGKPCTDHLGRKFASVRERAEFYGMIPSVVHNRMKSGWSLERALTVPAVTNPHERPVRKPCTDHYGRQFSSVSSMAAYYGMNARVLCCRLRQGWTPERALTEAVRKTAVRRNRHED